MRASCHSWAGGLQAGLSHLQGQQHSDASGALDKLADMVCNQAARVAQGLQGLGGPVGDCAGLLREAMMREVVGRLSDDLAAFLPGRLGWNHALPHEFDDSAGEGCAHLPWRPLREVYQPRPPGCSQR